MARDAKDRPPPEEFKSDRESFEKSLQSDGLRSARELEDVRNQWPSDPGDDTDESE